MKPFATLLDRLTLTPSRNQKIQLMVDYFASQPDPDRGWGLAAITRDLDIPAVKPAMLRGMVAERMDEQLFRMSYDYVGDLAETIALVWDADRRTAGLVDAPSAEDAPSISDVALMTRDQRVATPPKHGRNSPLTLDEVVTRLLRLPKTEALRQVEEWLDLLDASGRYALLKLMTGGMRIGVSARLAKQACAALAKRNGVDVDIIEIEEIWHGLEAPYEDLFAWLTGAAEKPTHRAEAPFRPVMLATPIADAKMSELDASAYAAEWKWDGIRVQATGEGDTRRLYSRTGDDIGRAFPDLIDALDFHGSIDGELLVGSPLDDGSIQAGSFADLQQRLNRKTVSKKMLTSHPVFIRAYDLLDDAGENLRGLTFEERRGRLEKFIPKLNPQRFDLSPMVPFQTWDDLAETRENLPHPIIEGVMVKRWDSTYVPGRPKGPWFKWKRDPMIIDAVMMYAQRGHGKRSSYYSDYTFGVWTEEGELVPVGKAYFGFTDEELKKMDKFVRDNTIDRFGPVRSVKAQPDFGLVLEVAFEGLQRSTRHKSGIAMRFPRISKLRWDKPPREADTLASVEALLEQQTSD
ncbi:cisplatin damage response ATP-dependent DNA ligase [Ahrensia sp. R2A130]|uniref:cisplatin damage response ATP-dependent DNA ligase n=1 Tax=Ahrensia sp. R2A130 TaxID=744979 RepID=UPI0001E0CA50|nr:cisplatin damage response ATP-dependent DNA ligase [Ahrensia sp. R2A130]EFL87642.1 ATP-dependent DNA ligase [Ahrensia sp. R2A130]